MPRDPKKPASFVTGLRRARIAAVMLGAFAITTAVVASASQRTPSPYDQAVPPRPTEGNLPRNFAASMYQAILARLSFGQPESIVEPLLYLARSDPDMADLQNSVAVALYLSRTDRARATAFANRAVAIRPDDPVFAVVRVLVDPTRSRMGPNGNVILTRSAADELGRSNVALEAGSANMKLLAQILRSVRSSAQDPDFPMEIADTERLLVNPGILMTSPDVRSFGIVEDKIRARITALQNEAVSAKRSADQAQSWLADLQKQWQSAPEDKRNALLSQQQERRAEFETWMTTAHEKATAVNSEFEELNAFLKRDWGTLARLRIAREGEDAVLVAAAPNRDLPSEAASQASGAERSSTMEIGNAGPNWVPERRIALVIGNSSYRRKDPHSVWPDLDGGPIRDATAVGERLNQLGFTVLKGTDADLQHMDDLFTGFQKRIAEDPARTFAFVYYSGHGVSAPRGGGHDGDDSYLIPIDTDLVREVDARRKAIALADVRSALESSGVRAAAIVLDACRDNNLRRDSRGGTRGLAPLTTALPGMLIAYSTATGEVASNRPGEMSIYTQALVKALGRPGESLTTMFRRVRAQVVSAPGYSSAVAQRPELSDSLNEDVVLRTINASDH